MQLCADIYLHTSCTHSTAICMQQKFSHRNRLSVDVWINVQRRCFCDITYLLPFISHWVFQLYDFVSFEQVPKQWIQLKVSAHSFHLISGSNIWWHDLSSTINYNINLFGMHWHRSIYQHTFYAEETGTHCVRNSKSPSIN